MTKSFELIEVMHNQNPSPHYSETLTTAIVQSKESGRLLIRDGYGGVDSLRGASVSFLYGSVIRLLPTDTIDYLQSQDYNEASSLWLAIIGGYDKSRPYSDWSGWGVYKLSRRLGLC